MGYLPQYKTGIFLSNKHATNKSPGRWGHPRGDKWLKETYEGLDTTAIFPTTLTPQYIQSEVCVMELDHILDRVMKPEERIKPIIMPVHKLPPEGSLPPELKSIQGVKFYQEQPPMEFVQGGSREAFPYPVWALKIFRN